MGPASRLEKLQTRFHAANEQPSNDDDSLFIEFVLTFAEAMAAEIAFLAAARADEGASKLTNHDSSKTFVASFSLLTFLRPQSF